MGVLLEAVDAGEEAFDWLTVTCGRGLSVSRGVVSARGFEDLLLLGHNWSLQQESRITAKYFIKSIIQQLPWEANREMEMSEREGRR